MHNKPVILFPTRHCHNHNLAAGLARRDTSSSHIPQCTKPRGRQGRKIIFLMIHIFERQSPGSTFRKSSTGTSRVGTKSNRNRGRKRSESSNLRSAEALVADRRPPTNDGVVHRRAQRLRTHPATETSSRQKPAPAAEHRKPWHTRRRTDRPFREARSPNLAAAREIRASSRTTVTVAGSSGNT